MNLVKTGEDPRFAELKRRVGLLLLNDQVIFAVPIV